MLSGKRLDIKWIYSETFWRKVNNNQYIIRKLYIFFVWNFDYIFGGFSQSGKKGKLFFSLFASNWKRLLRILLTADGGVAEQSPHLSEWLFRSGNEGLGKGTNFSSAWIRLKLNTKIGLHITTTHHPQPPHPPTTTHHTNSSAAISQLLLIRVWSNFESRALGTSTRYSNCHCDICPGDICPINICPYQQYLSCYWLNLDQTLKAGSWHNI